MEKRFATPPTSPSRKILPSPSRSVCSIGSLGSFPVSNLRHHDTDEWNASLVMTPVPSGKPAAKRRKLDVDTSFDSNVPDVQLTPISHIGVDPSHHHELNEASLGETTGFELPTFEDDRVMNNLNQASHDQTVPPAPPAIKIQSPRNIPISPAKSFCSVGSLFSLEDWNENFGVPEQDPSHTAPPPPPPVILKPKEEISDSDKGTSGCDSDSESKPENQNKYKGFSNQAYPEEEGYEWCGWQKEPNFNPTYGKLNDEVQDHQIKICLGNPKFRKSTFFAAVKRTAESGENNWMYVTEFMRYHGFVRNRTTNNFNNGLMFRHSETPYVIPSRPQCFKCKIHKNKVNPNGYKPLRGLKLYSINPRWLELYNEHECSKENVDTSN